MKSSRLTITLVLVAAFLASIVPLARAGEEEPALTAAGGHQVRLASASAVPAIVADAPVGMEQPTWQYNTDYLFAVSRALADSSLHPAARVPLFVFTIPVDIALLVPALIGGFFG